MNLKIHTSASGFCHWYLDCDLSQEPGEIAPLCPIRHACTREVSAVYCSTLVQSDYSAHCVWPNIPIKDSLAHCKEKANFLVYHLLHKPFEVSIEI